MGVQFGIIGCGNISRFHLEGIEKCGGEVALIIDVNQAAAGPWVNRTGARFSKDYRKVMDDPEVEVVSILTGAKSHKEMCLAAIEAGKHVVCEKTMTNSVEEGFEVVQASRKKGLFFTAFMKRFFPAVDKMKELLPDIGTVFQGTVRTFQQWGNFYAGEGLGDFSAVVDTYGGAVLKCAGSHMLDLIAYLMGRPDSVYCHIDYVPETRFDRKVSAVFSYKRGTSVLFEAAAHPLKKIGYERNSWDEFFEITGTGGRLTLYTVKWDVPEGNAPLLLYYDNRTGTVTEFRFDPVNPFDREIAAIAEAVREGKQRGPGVIDGFNVDAMISSMEESHRQGRMVLIDYMGV